MSASRKPLSFYLAPSTWPTWIGLGLLRVVCWLPHRAALAVGRGLGHIAYRFGGKRRAIVHRNLELCFPDLDAGDERRRSGATAFRVAGHVMVIEMGLGRWASDKHLDSI